MGGAQPLAVTMNEGVALCIEVDPARAQRRLETRFVDRLTGSVDEALAWARDSARAGQPESIALIGNAAEIEPELVRRRERFDAVTDQTSAHDALNGYVPAGLSVADAEVLRMADPAEYVRRSIASMGDQVRAMLELQAAGAVTFDYGNNIRAGVHPAAVLRRQGPLPLGGTVGRPGRHPPHG
jgi:urocanate hydratase